MRQIPPPQDPFEQWALEQSSPSTRRPLNATSVQAYRLKWLAWRKWLASRQLDWSHATARDISDFLNGPPPGQDSPRNHAPSTTKPMAAYTRQRYWHLLDSIYRSAALNGLIESSPASTITPDEQPHVGPRERQPNLLPPALLSLLNSSERLRQIIPLSSDNDWWHVRDRAIMALLTQTGITSSETLRLRGCDVLRADRSPLLPLQQRLLPGSEGLLIDVMASATLVRRSIAVDAAMAEPILHWARWREQLLAERAARVGTLQQREEFLRQHSLQGPFFITRRAREASTTLPALDQTALYHTVSSALREAQRLLNPNEPVRAGAKGPAVLRNSVLRQWVRTLGVTEAVRRAGLKDAESLRFGTGDVAAANPSPPEDSP